MLKRKKQEIYFRKRASFVLFHLRKFYAFGDTEELHRVRVEIKKIKALFSLDKKRFEKKEFASHIKKMNKLFKFAGKIRSAQVNLELMETYKIENATMEQRQTDELIHEAESFCDRKDLSVKKMDKHFSALFGKFQRISGKVLETVFEKEIEKLTKIFSEKTNDKQLHVGRKQLKNIIYTKDIFHSKKPELKFSYLKKLEEFIGKWHDLQIAIGMLGVVDQDIEMQNKLQLAENKQKDKIHLLARNFKRKAIEI